MDRYFDKYRENTIGHGMYIQTPYGQKKLIYADWMASGRLYAPIEHRLSNVFGPYVANPHTETSETGTITTIAYQQAQKIIKAHVNANENDVLITGGAGMTALINKFQRILGLKTSCRFGTEPLFEEHEKPVVFVTHMEHHSNHTSWLETAADVVIIKPDRDLKVDPESLRAALEKYKDRRYKYGAFTACSNVTGVQTPVADLARLMHEYGGYIFVDYSASAPYVNINMHPSNPRERLDAVIFSPHKFLGGPGSSGVLLFNRILYTNKTPDQPGGGTVDWTNPWGEHRYIGNIEAREDGGTPGFIQAVKTALCMQLKDEMGVENIQMREAELLDRTFRALKQVAGLRILAEEEKERIGVVSFCVEGMHYNLIVKMLNDRYGIQVRGGCACAGTYGHLLLGIDREASKRMTDDIDRGVLIRKIGWVRLSLHPLMTNEELEVVMRGIKEVVGNYHSWKEDYDYLPYSNEFTHRKDMTDKVKKVKSWFQL